MNTTHISVRIVGIPGEIRMRQILNSHIRLQCKTSVHPGKNFECHERSFFGFPQPLRVNPVMVARNWVKFVTL